MKPYQVNLANEVRQYQSSMGHTMSPSGADTLSLALSAIATAAIAERLERIAELLETIAGPNGTKVKP